MTGQHFRQRDHRTLFDRILPFYKRLRRISIYEDSNHSYCYPPSDADPDPVAGETLGALSKSLKELYVCWVVGFGMGN